LSPDCVPIVPVTAFAPGSVTTVFVPQDSESSLGVSFATADGVTATVESASATILVLDGRPAEVEPVSGVLRRLDAPAVTVRLDTDLPIGCGFGVSGAATLATALATNAQYQLGHAREDLVEAAHRAEVAAGTGLGDVFIQERGGLVWDAGDGLRHTERTARIEYASYGDIATADVLGDASAMERVVTAGTKALDALDLPVPLPTLFDVSWAFADHTGLATERVAATVRAVQEAGGAATMAMIGETVVATEIKGMLDNETHITPMGAQLR
jgi:pantoate kinase